VEVWWLSACGVLAVLGGALMIQSLWRKNSLRGLVAMTVEMTAAVPAAVYATMVS
jgi:hypothetical protein